MNRHSVTGPHRPTFAAAGVLHKAWLALLLLVGLAACGRDAAPQTQTSETLTISVQALPAEVAAVTLQVVGGQTYNATPQADGTATVRLSNADAAPGTKTFIARGFDRAQDGIVLYKTVKEVTITAETSTIALLMDRISSSVSVSATNVGTNDELVIAQIAGSEARLIVGGATASGTVSGVATGREISVLVSAYDAAGTLTRQGSATLTTLSEADGSITVPLPLGEANAQAPDVPVITAPAEVTEDQSFDVLVTASDSNGGDIELETLEVNWGDGSPNSSVAVSGQTASETFSHTYTGAGSQTITVTVTNSEDLQTPASVPITVTPADSGPTDPTDPNNPVDTVIDVDRPLGDVTLVATGVATGTDQVQATVTPTQLEGQDLSFAPLDLKDEYVVELIPRGSGSWSATLELPLETEYSLVFTADGDDSNTFYFTPNADSTTQTRVFNAPGEQPITNPDPDPEPEPVQACSPRSTLPCSAIQKGTPFSLTFNGTESGLSDTGFTMVDPPSESFGGDGALVTTEATGYAPSKLTVSGGSLKIESTRGFNARALANNGNSQLNALGVGLDVTDPIVLMTSLSNLPSVGGAFEQSGLWFGLNEANFIKLVVLSRSSNAYNIQLSREINDATTSNDEVGPTATVLPGSAITFRMVLDPNTNTATGSYSTNGGTSFTEVGSLSLPASFFSGTAVSSSDNTPQSFAGVFATSRNSTTPRTFTFEDFSVEEDEVEIVEPPQLSNAVIATLNLDGVANGALQPGFFNDWLTFSRIGGGLYGGMQFHETATLRVLNTASSDTLTISDLAVSSGFSLPNGETSLSIVPGGSYDLQVRFITASGGRGIRRGALTLTSNASNQQTTTVQLAGAYMVTPEGDREVTAQEIVNAFSFTTNIGQPLRAESTSPLAGDEVRAKFWTRANTSQPIYVRQIAAFHGCCTAQDQIQIGSGSFRHKNVYGQSLLPEISDSTAPAAMTVSPTGQFDIKIAGYTTNTTGNLGVRLWPAEDRSGSPIQDTYIVIQDFVQNGCGGGSANCDYNDNMYIVTNIKPVQ